MITIVIFLLFLTIYKIFAKEVKLENGGQSNEKKTELTPFDCKCSNIYFVIFLFQNFMRPTTYGNREVKMNPYIHK